MLFPLEGRRPGVLARGRRCPFTIRQDEAEEGVAEDGSKQTQSTANNTLTYLSS